MALHHELPIYRTGAGLLSLALKVQEQMRDGPPRTGFAGPLKGSPSVAWQSQLHEGRWMGGLLRAAQVAQFARPCTSGVGIGVPEASAAQSRTRTVAAFLFGQTSSMVARQGSRKARRFPLRGCTGTPTLSGCRPDWRRGGSRFTTCTPGANMAINLSPHETRTLARAQSILERQLQDPRTPRFTCGILVRSYLQIRMAPLDHEQVHAMFLDAQHALLATEVLGIGTLTSCQVHPREIARAALRLNAHAVILAHNHPSGAAAPSAADRSVTRAVQAALQLVGMELIDHLVVTAAEVCSAAERGVL